jgi:CRP/FNR family transcriptional regulator, cyclic AMP receptor protein
MELTKRIRLLQELPVISALSPSEIEGLASQALLRAYDKFDYIFTAEEPSEWIFFLLSGRLKLGILSADGREVIKEVIQPVSMFGDRSLVGETRRNEYAQVMYEPVEVLQVPAGHFRHIMADNQGLTLHYLGHLTRRLQRMEERLTSLVLKDARERIIEFLVSSAGNNGRQVGMETLVKHNLTQQDIANLTGTSRQTVTSVLNELKKMNLIHFNRNSFLIRDLNKLG